MSDLAARLEAFLTARLPDADAVRVVRRRGTHGGLLGGDVLVHREASHGTPRRARRLGPEARTRRRPARTLRSRTRVPRAARALRRSPALPAHAVVRSRCAPARAPVLRDGAHSPARCRFPRRARTARVLSPPPSAAALARPGDARARRSARDRLEGARTRRSSAHRQPGVAPALREVERWAERIAASGVRDGTGRRRGARLAATTRTRVARRRTAARRLPARQLADRAGRRAARGSPACSTGRWSTSGDPIEDVAWCISHLWRGSTPRAACLASPEDLVTLYEAGFRTQHRPHRAALLRSALRGEDDRRSC